MTEFVIGLDLGTQGVRALAVERDGRVAGQEQLGLGLLRRDLPAGWLEQDPEEWWRAASACLRQLSGALPKGSKVAGICVDSTSGTVLPVDADGKALHPAVMYNDNRSENQTRQVQIAGQAHQKRFGFAFGSSFGLPKIAWFREERADLFARTRRFLHAADYLAGRLGGEFRWSDTSNALKSGYDLIDFRWPDFIESELGIPIGKLPEVAAIGAQIGRVCAQAAEECGLDRGTPIFAGATDGTAAQVASGAAQPGEWNSTLGTTLVFKGVSRDLAPDPLGRVYSHRHPEGWWMPGGASNTGTDWIQAENPGADYQRLDETAAGFVPTRLLRYPLHKQGERFPFARPEAQGFLAGSSSGAEERYAAGLEGIAMIERLAYETLAEIGLEAGERIYLTGGGCKSELLSRIRASVLQKTLAQPEVTETAFGAAVIAASGCWYVRLSQAAQAMVRVAQMIEPNPAWTRTYDDLYGRFKEELQRRGYLEAEA